MALPEANYKNMAEFAEYARQRALISAKQEKPQDFAYWVRMMELALSRLRPG